MAAQIYGVENNSASSLMDVLAGSALPPREQVPMRVAMALRFVALSNESMGLRVFPAGMETYESHEMTLHPAQEDAFVRACLCLQRYFDEK